MLRLVHADASPPLLGVAQHLPLYALDVLRLGLERLDAPFDLGGALDKQLLEVSSLSIGAFRLD